MISSDRQKPPSMTMSYEEYHVWSNENTYAEWVDGQVVLFGRFDLHHQEVLGFLLMLMHSFIQLHDAGTLWKLPFELHLRNSARLPDLMFLAKENQHHLTEEGIEGYVDLVIEIISAGSGRRDRQTKMKEYAAAGIPEYWIIDPRTGKQRADFYRLDETGRYQLFGMDEDEWVESEVLKGFRLRPQWLWQTESLNPYLALGEMLGNETFLALLKQNLESHSE